MDTSEEEASENQRRDEFGSDSDSRPPKSENDSSPEGESLGDKIKEDNNQDRIFPSVSIPHVRTLKGVRKPNPVRNKIPPKKRRGKLTPAKG